MTAEKDSAGDYAVPVVGAVCLALVLGGLYFYLALPPALEPKVSWADRGNAVAPFGALLSAAAVFAALWSVRVQQKALAAQREDLELQRQELAATREEMVRQREEMRQSREAQEARSEIAKQQIEVTKAQVAAQTEANRLQHLGAAVRAIDALTSTELFRGDSQGVNALKLEVGAQLLQQLEIKGAAERVLSKARSVADQLREIT